MASKQAPANQRPCCWCASFLFPFPAALRAAPRADSPSATVTGGRHRHVYRAVPALGAQVQVFFFRLSCWDLTCSLAGYVELCGLGCSSRGQICRFMASKRLSTYLCHGGKKSLRIFFRVSAFAVNLTIKMCSFQGKQLRRWYLLTCSHRWLFEAQLSDLWDKSAPWVYSVWCGKSNILRLIGGTSLLDMLLHITFNIKWLLCLLSVWLWSHVNSPVRGGLINHQIDTDRVAEYLTATPI